MRIAFAFPARHVDTLHDRSHLASGIGSNVFQIDGVPVPLQVPVLVFLESPPQEAKVEHPLSIRVLGPDLLETGEPIEIPIALDAGPGTPDGWNMTAILPIGVAFEVKEPGTHSIELAVDAKTFSIPLVVVAANEV